MTKPIKVTSGVAVSRSLQEVGASNPGKYRKLIAATDDASIRFTQPLHTVAIIADVERRRDVVVGHVEPSEDSFSVSVRVNDAGARAVGMDPEKFAQSLSSSLERQGVTVTEVSLWGEKVVHSVR